MDFDLGELGIHSVPVSQTKQRQKKDEKARTGGLVAGTVTRKIL